ncbi:G-protein coupled receptor 151-like [Megalops cyprinoides]|uniref:G-protein coupled receptor 151-like n=1 Tax=Megalops cyprinoides TaxID=118141 RepID=UPI0018651D75|nr:G-protein coupled receptor 151-like [Megalops cyprinoides]
MDKLQNLNISDGNRSVDQQSFFDGGTYHNLDSQELKVLIPVILGVICVLGFTGNVTAIGVLVTNARKGKLSLINSLILNLILADSMVLAFAVPFKAVSYSRAGWILGWFLCKACDWFLHSCMAAKSFTIAIMAKACYRYVSNPTKQVNIHYRTILVILLGCWLLACAVPVPHWMFAILRQEGKGLVCVQDEPPSAHRFMTVYVKVYPLVAYCAPLSFALLFFWRAYGRCQRRGSKTQNLRTQIRSRKLTLMLFGLTVTTATMWLPQWVSWVWAHHAAQAGGPAPPPPLGLSAQLLAFSISLVNPLIVLSLSEEFREGYKGLWRRLTLRKHPPKNKLGPHTPTAPRSPSPRPETGGGHPPPPPQHRQGRAEEPSAERDPEPGCAEPNSPGNKEGVVLPDVEQFWHERETGSLTEENDPVPWEHQESAEAKQGHA